MRALVTGGAGFIGHHLVRALLDAGHEVAVIDDLSTGDRGRLAAVAHRIDFLEGDVRDPAALDLASAGAHVVFHQAALASVERSVRNPRLVADVNIGGTIEVMEAARRHAVRRVIFAGSSSVYGLAPGQPRRESQRPDPRSPYAAGKLAAEHIIHSLGAIHGIETVVLRYFNIFGPGQDPASEYAAVVPRFVTAALNGGRPVVHGDGRQTRDFTFVTNAIQANLLAATTPGVSGLTANVGCGESFSLLDLIDAIAADVGVTLRPSFGPSRVGDVPDSLADIETARRALRYRVLVPFRDGVSRTVNWYRDAAESPGANATGLQVGSPATS